MTGTLRVAVVGVGHLGRYHAQKYAQLPGCDLVGVVDTEPRRAQRVASELNVSAYPDLATVLERAEAVSIATPTQDHHQTASACLRAGLHTLVEKPLAATPEEGQALVELAQAQGRILQVGYLERFNPAFVACRPRISNPRFIEALRISPYVGRGTDVDVVLDLMSHDLDLVASLVDAPLAQLHAVGLSLMTSSTDLAHVHMVFEDGCVANLTASRISTKAERKMRLFQQDRYFSIDFAEPTAREYAALAEPGNAIPIREEPLRIPGGDALLAEIESFTQAVRGGGPAVVDGAAGLQAMALADRVMQDITRNARP